MLTPIDADVTFGTKIIIINSVIFSSVSLQSENSTDITPSVHRHAVDEHSRDWLRNQFLSPMRRDERKSCWTRAARNKGEEKRHPKKVIRVAY